MLIHPDKLPRPKLILSLVLLVHLVSLRASGIVVEYPVETDIPSLQFHQSFFSGINTIYIPFTLVGQLIVVEARVDTITGNFIMDTGAERLVLNQQYFGRERHSSVASSGNTGPVSAASWTTVDSIGIERLSIMDLRAHLVDLHHIELKKNTRIIGILGYHVFSAFEIFIDFQNHVIGLSMVDRDGQRVDRSTTWESPADSVGFLLKNHLIVVNTVVNGTKFRMILDSGAELNLLDRRVHRKVLDNFTILKRVNLTGVGRREIEVLAGILTDLRCGDQHCPSMNTLITSMDEINENFGVSAHGVLGYEFLNTRRMLINYQKRKLYFFNPIRP